MRNYLQLDDKFFKVTLDDKNAPVVTPCTPQEVLSVQFENIALLDETVVDTSMLQSIVDKMRVDIEQALETNLKRLVLSALGFSWHQRDGNDGFVISGFNNTDSPIAKHIVAKLQEKVFNMDLDREFGLTDLEKSNLKKAMLLKFKETYKDHMNGKVWNAARSLAEEHVKEGVREMAGGKLKEISEKLLSEAVYRSKLNGNPFKKTT
jgi:hypothetical protein